MTSMALSGETVQAFESLPKTPRQPCPAFNFAHAGAQLPFSRFRAIRAKSQRNLVRAHSWSRSFVMTGILFFPREAHPRASETFGRVSHAG